MVYNRCGGQQPGAQQIQLCTTPAIAAPHIQAQLRSTATCVVCVVVPYQHDVVHTHKRDLSHWGLLQRCGCCTCMFPPQLGHCSSWLSAAGGWLQGQRWYSPWWCKGPVLLPRGSDKPLCSWHNTAAAWLSHTQWYNGITVASQSCNPWVNLQPHMQPPTTASREWAAPWPLTSSPPAPPPPSTHTCMTQPEKHSMPHMHARTGIMWSSRYAAERGRCSTD